MMWKFAREQKQRQPKKSSGIDRRKKFERIKNAESSRGK